jgi:membrane-bound lytic murein transglycosylase D
MKELYGEFGDWLLVVAAYNGGPGRVRQAIRKSGSRDFWNLQYHLPEETRNHVKKFIGTHYIFEGTGGVTTMTAAEMEQQKASKPPSDIADTHEQVPVTGRFLSSVVAASLGIELKAFLAVNPGFDQKLAAGKTYWMNLPVGLGKKELFESKKPELLLTSLQTLLAGQELMK